MVTKQDLHPMVDELPESAVAKAIEGLQKLRDAASPSAETRSALTADHPEIPEK